MSILNRGGRRREPFSEMKGGKQPPNPPPPPVGRTEPPPPPPPPARKPENEARSLMLTDRDDLAYLEAVADLAPRLMARTDMNDPLTDWWRQIVKGLITVAKAHESMVGVSLQHEAARVESPEPVPKRASYEELESVIEAARLYIHSSSDEAERQKRYTAWRDTYGKVFGVFPSFVTKP